MGREIDSRNGGGAAEVPVAHKMAMMADPEVALQVLQSREFEELATHSFLRMTLNRTIMAFPSIRRTKVVWSIGRVLDLILVIVWSVVLLGVWIVKYLGDGSIDDHTYGKYLTNWSWSIQTVYFWMKLIGYMESIVAIKSSYREVIYHWVNRIAFWPTFTVVKAVFWMVFIVLYQAPQLLTDNFDAYGAGAVFLADRFMHVVTLVVLGFDMAFCFFDHIDMLNLRPKRLILFVLLQMITTHIIVFTYMALNNFAKVYDLGDTSFWEVLGVFELTAVCPALILMLFVFSPIGNSWLVCQLTPDIDHFTLKKVKKEGKARKREEEQKKKKRHKERS